MKPLEVVQTLFARFEKGDVDGVLALCGENVEWVVNGPADLEDCRAFRGRDGVRQMLALVDEAQTFSSFETREFITAGDTIVVLGEAAGTMKTSNAPFVHRFAHVFDVPEGLIVRFREFLCVWNRDERPPSMTWGDLSRDG